MSWQERRIRRMAHVRRYLESFTVHQGQSRRRLAVIVLAVWAGLFVLGALACAVSTAVPHYH